MPVILFQVAGVLAFFAITVALGIAIRRRPDADQARRLSRISHALFWGGLVFPEILGLAYPGAGAFDRLLGLPLLPFSDVTRIAGVALFVVGVYFLVASNLALKKLGSGFAAFGLTRRVVNADIYATCRNPMSLGTYLSYLGIGLATGSTYMTLGTLLGVIPVHVFNLWFFEEHELLARHGNGYRAYRENTPFLLPLGSAK